MPILILVGGAAFALLLLSSIAPPSSTWPDAALFGAGLLALVITATIYAGQIF